VNDDGAIDASRRMLVSGLGALALGSLAVLTSAQTRERVIDVVAKRFDFVPEEIHVARGEAVVLRFTAPDVPMGFHLPDFDLREDLVPGAITTVRLTPDRIGSFTFMCDVFCGSGHEEMSGTLIVA